MNPRAKHLKHKIPSNNLTCNMAATIKKLNKHNIIVVTDNCASRQKTKFKCPTLHWGNKKI